MSRYHLKNIGIPPYHLNNIDIPHWFHWAKMQVVAYLLRIEINWQLVIEAGWKQWERLAAEFLRLLGCAFLVRCNMRDAFAILPLARLRNGQICVECLSAVARWHCKLVDAQLVGEQSAIVHPLSGWFFWLRPG